ncbi:MFS transporter [Actinoplanes siamensis]|uniref:MFS transporter n=1 Tax=Actinoplanes siamensis TaxID=1223317 RepID=A0A919N739_9ACTN|nr:hypothetical protein [Actinoplanes siamensis]GIF05504.1 hypothetical protein Asi03nite_30420 [Actinoplanes siamensis]
MTLARYLVAAVSVRLADEGARVAIVLLALERAHDAALGGLLVAALMVPHVLAGPLVGAAHTHRPALTGLLVSACAAGGLLGSVLCTRLPVVHRLPERVLLLCTAAMTVPFLLAVAGTPAVFFAVAGGLSGIVAVALFTTRDREAPPELRTQVFTLGAGFKVTAGAAGSAAGGLLASYHPAVLLVAIAACQLAGGLAGGLLLRRAPDRAPETTPAPSAVSEGR